MSQWVCHGAPGNLIASSIVSDRCAQRHDWQTVVFNVVMVRVSFGERERDSEKERKNIDFVQVSVSLHMHATLTVAAYLGRMRYLIFPHTNALQHRQGIQGTSNPEQWFNQRDAGLC